MRTKILKTAAVFGMVLLLAVCSISSLRSLFVVSSARGQEAKLTDLQKLLNDGLVEKTQYSVYGVSPCYGEKEEFAIDRNAGRDMDESRYFPDGGLRDPFNNGGKTSYGGLRDPFSFGGMNYIGEVVINRAGSTLRALPSPYSGGGGSSCGSSGGGGSSGIGSGMGGSGGGGSYGGAADPMNQQLAAQDLEPFIYVWRDKLKEEDGFEKYLPKTEGMFKSNPDGTLVYDKYGKEIQVLDAFNCHYDAFGANNDPNSYNKPFTKIVFDPNFSNFNELAPTEKIRVGDRVSYLGWPNADTKMVLHSATVTKVDANGYATEVRSKMGESYGIIFHHPRDIPEGYGVTSPYSRFPNGIVRYNRVYYRPK